MGSIRYRISVLKRRTEGEISNSAQSGGKFWNSGDRFGSGRESGLNLFKRQVYDLCLRTELSLSNNARPLTEQGLALLKRSDIWIGDTGATMHSSFCGAHGLNKCATTLSSTGMSGGSIKPSLQMDLDCITINKDGNAVGPVRLENVPLLESSNYNLFILSKLLNSG